MKGPTKKSSSKIEAYLNFGLADWGYPSLYRNPKIGSLQIISPRTNVRVMPQGLSMVSNALAVEL